MISRHITGQVKEALADTPVVLINGARQTGKSTLVQSEELGEKNRQYLTFDDPGVLAAAKGDANGFIAGLDPRVTLDEVQHVPELFPVIKAAIDRKRQPGRFLLTGIGKRNAPDEAIRVPGGGHRDGDHMALQAISPCFR